MLTALAEADRRGAQIVHVNPLVEAAATRTIVPHDFTDMALFKTTKTSTLNLQPRIGGDMALLRGMAKAVLEKSASDPKALDRTFIDRHTTGFEEYRELCEATPWEELEHQSGLSRAEILKAAQVYEEADRSIVSWCLGLTQHEHGVDTVREIVNLLLLRGNLGREGAGPSPVRGHSNVQGNRTCGIDHRPTEEFLDRLAETCGIDPPREHGLDTVGTIQAMREGEVKVFVGMGGNFALAAPDTPATYAALRSCDLTVQVSTKLNRSHVVHGRAALILPCLGRTEKDHQRGGVQSTSVEDSMSMVHLSLGMKRPASPHLLSEPAIVAGMARAALPDSETPWDWYIEDYDRIRDTMAEALDGFEDFNRRVRLPLGFRIKQPARELVFLTPSGRAEFSAAPLPDVGARARHPGARHDAVARPVEHHHLLRQRPLPGHQEPAHADLHEPGRHARTRDRRHGSCRHHEHGEGRQPAVPERLHGDPVRHSARLCGRVHAGDERAVRAGRLQHPERPADHE
ncbi:oxidoreductase alpha (molybdopterin) subunit, partial [Streptomyces sp. Ncost-T6T-2b]